VLAFFRTNPGKPHLKGIAGVHAILSFVYLRLLMPASQYKQRLSLLVDRLHRLQFGAHRRSPSHAPEQPTVCEFRGSTYSQRVGEIGPTTPSSGVYKTFNAQHSRPPEQLGTQLTSPRHRRCLLHRLFARARRFPASPGLFLTIAAILPPVSYDYTLLHLYTPSS